jgi:outer membrane immunogenic protein
MRTIRGEGNAVKKLALALILMTIGALPATAADLPVKAPPPVPLPGISWTGIYVGGHAGYAWSDAHWLTNHVDGVGPCLNGNFITPCDPVDSKTSGFAGGGQVGGRWQTGAWVFGVEGTWTGVDLVDTRTSVLLPGQLNYYTKIRDTYTATGQVGYAWNRSLVYVKGGYAGARLALNSITVPGGTTGPVNVNANGWTIGGGFEYSVTSNLSLGIEYNHLRLDADDVATCSPNVGSVFSCPVPPSLPLRYTNIRTDIDQVLLRLNYRFNWLTAGPVVAKY